MSHDENVPGGVPSADDAELVIRSASLQRVMKLAEKVARHPAAVLIVGETGSGKEMIARTIHNHSLRCNQPLVDVNCARSRKTWLRASSLDTEKGPSAARTP